MKLIARMFLVGVALVCLSGLPAHAENPDSPIHVSFNDSLRRFGLNHDRTAFRFACQRAVAAEPNYALPIFYLGVLAEADENWSEAQTQFQRFVALEKNTDLTVKAQHELQKLPGLIKQDSTPSGKLNREYREHLAFAAMLQKERFAKEALLESAAAAKLVPSRWEAYAVASSIMLSQGQVDQANHFLRLAKQHAPASATAKLDSLAAAIQRSTENASASKR